MFDDKDEIDKLISELIEKKPKHVKWFDNYIFRIHFNNLKRLLKGIFIIDCPMEWDKDYMLDCLIECGYFTITDTAFGIIPLRSGVSGLNVFDKPNKAIFSNNILGSFERLINIECVPIKINGNYVGVTNILGYFAKRLAMADSSIDMNLLNTKVGFLARCASKKQAENLKGAFDNIMSGEPLTVVGEDVIGNGFEPFFNNIKSQYICNDVIETKKEIMNEFLTLIGINNNRGSSKKERQTVDEVNVNNTEIKSYIEYWKLMLEQSMEICRFLYPDLDFNISIKSSLNELDKGE